MGLRFNPATYPNLVGQAAGLKHNPTEHYGGARHGCSGFGYTARWKHNPEGHYGYAEHGYSGLGYNVGLKHNPQYAMDRLDMSIVGQYMLLK